MEPKFSVSVRFGFGSRFFRVGPRFSVFLARDCLGELFAEAGEHVSIGPPPLRGGARDRLSC